MNHLKDVQECYFTHMKEAFLFGFKCLHIALISFVHGIFPNLYCQTATDKYFALAEWVESRRQHLKDKCDG